jgi:hypothetical protein
VVGEFCAGGEASVEIVVLLLLLVDCGTWVEVVALVNDWAPVWFAEQIPIKAARAREAAPLGEHGRRGELERMNWS